MVAPDRGWLQGWPQRSTRTVAEHGAEVRAGTAGRLRKPGSGSTSLAGTTTAGRTRASGRGTWAGPTGAPAGRTDGAWPLSSWVGPLAA